jgi:hypothetical protein
MKIKRIFYFSRAVRAMRVVLSFGEAYAGQGWRREEVECPLSRGNLT